MDGLKCVVLATMMLVLSVGCRTSQPNLKPQMPKFEKLTEPPAEARFESPQYPKQALVDNNSRKSMFDDDKTATLPTRGSNSPGRGMGSGMGSGMGNGLR